MSKKSVFCIATSRPQADQIVDQLKSANFSNNDISVLFPDKGTTHDFAHEKHTKAPEGVATGASTGGVIGGALGWIAGIGALAIPGVGPFIAAGPIPKPGRRTSAPRVRRRCPRPASRASRTRTPTASRSRLWQPTAAPAGIDRNLSCGQDGLAAGPFPF